MDIGSGTRLIALLGDPVGHSLSPRIQNAAIRAAGIDAVYLALRCAPASIDALMRAITAAGGAGNVTLPLKERAARALDARTPAVVKTGACNCFWWLEDRLHGDNTDVEGFFAAARQLIGAPAGARALVIGAGGAARAAVVALLEARADAIHVMGRTAARSGALRDELDPTGRRVAVVDRPEPLRREGYDLVVNTTPLGLHPDDPLPLDLDQPGRVGAVLDLAYRSEPTEWVLAARARGIPAADGLEMLLHQGAAAFRRWFDTEPDLAVMRAHLEG
jgi:shikimate dehydrogenase